MIGLSTKAGSVMTKFTGGSLSAFLSCNISNIICSCSVQKVIGVGSFCDGSSHAIEYMIVVCLYTFVSRSFSGLNLRPFP